ncbi:hypothetical protein V7183_25805, partial [Bacillus sp. JJ1127]|uniref:hypothetical protein n=1 Tax=Bacillus sp. JJ1127 TaxID=3122952 RepID=UPI002FFF18EF
VQQEENTYFLKKNAKDRMDSISQLFDTNKEELELKRLNSLKIKLETEYRKINEPNGLLTQKNKSLLNLTTGILDVDKEKLTQVEYSQLLSNNLEIKEWDKKDISIQKETRNRFLQELRDIYKLVRD